MPKKKPTKTKQRAVSKPVAEKPTSPDPSRIREEILAATPEPVMGAPRKEVDFEAFESLCQMHATEEEICWHFKMNHETLNARLMEKYGKTFSQVYPTLSVGGRMSLRRQLWMLAMGSEAEYDPRTGQKLREAIKPNAETARFLAKQPLERGGLGMRDAVTTEHEIGTGSYEQLLGICRELEDQKRSEK